MNILIVNQSVVDMAASFLTLLTAVVEVDGTHMSRDSSWDQFVCRIWLTRIPLWNFLTTSTYGIFLVALERYIAVIYPVWFNNKVMAFVSSFDRTVSIHRSILISMIHAQKTSHARSQLHFLEQARSQHFYRAMH